MYSSKDIFVYNHHCFRALLKMMIMGFSKSPVRKSRTSQTDEKWKESG